jgi:hypothetical protein
MEKTNITFEQARSAGVGTIFIDRFDEGLRFVVLRGRCSLCAYVGIPKDHPLAGHSYEDLPVQAHGGLTFAGNDIKGMPSDMFWYGWDYSHCYDFSFYDKDGDYNEKAKHWTPDDVAEDSWSALYDFRHLLKLAEAIASRMSPTVGRG